MARMLVDALETHRDALRSGRATAGAPLCNFFKPMPQYLKAYTGVEDWGWYAWANREWDTKWGDYDGSWTTTAPSELDPKGNSETGFETTITYVFNSAWNPPIAVIAYIVSLGYKVHFSYYEGGMGFGGCTPPEGVQYSSPSYDARNNLVIRPFDLEEFRKDRAEDAEFWNGWVESQGFNHAF